MGSEVDSWAAGSAAPACRRVMIRADRPCTVSQQVLLSSIRTMIHIAGLKSR